MIRLITSSSLIPSSLACSGICLSTRGVRTNPGRTTFARTLYGAASLATTLHNPISPCLAVTYGALSTEASFECTEPMYMMLPERARYIWRRQARVVRNAPSRWIAIMRLQSDNGKSTSGLTIWIPALLTRTSIRRYLIKVFSTASSTDASLTTSMITGNAWPSSPSSRAVACAASKLRSAIIAVPPALMKRAATSFPIPLAAPVMSATFPAKSGIGGSFNEQQQAVDATLHGRLRAGYSQRLERVAGDQPLFIGWDDQHGDA